MISKTSARSSQARKPKKSEITPEQKRNYAFAKEKQKRREQKEYYESQNRSYVTIWNQRHMMPMTYNPDLYAVSIDLDPNIDYGYDFEYKLFNFFRFIEHKYRVRIR